MKTLQLRNPYGITSNSELMDIMDKYREACENADRYLIYSSMKGGKIFSTSVPVEWWREMRVWSKGHRGSLGKTFIDACEWAKREGVI